MADIKPADKPIDKPARKARTVVPTGDAYNSLEDDGFRWMVAIDSLGGLRHGAVVGAHQLQPGTSISRLVENGYIVPMDAQQAAAHEAEHGPAVVPPYPTVDLQPAKPVIAPDQAHTLADDAKKADEAKHAADLKAKADADAKAKADADAKAKADADKK